MSRDITMAARTSRASSSRLDCGRSTGATRYSAGSRYNSLEVSSKIVSITTQSKSTGKKRGGWRGGYVAMVCECLGLSATISERGPHHQHLPKVSALAMFRRVLSHTDPTRPASGLTPSMIRARRRPPTPARRTWTRPRPAPSQAFACHRQQARHHPAVNLP